MEISHYNSISYRFIQLKPLRYIFDMSSPFKPRLLPSFQGVS